MKLFRNPLLALCILVGLSCPAAAQSACSAIVTGAILTASQWNACFQAKLDNVGSKVSGGIPYFSSTSTQASSAALAASQLVLGGGAGTAPRTLGALGSGTLVLHGNASGDPSFSAVNLSTDVSGVLPTSNGGTGNGFFAVSGPASTPKTYTFPNASDTVVTLTATQTLTNKSLTSPVLTNVTGSTQCLQANSAGVVSGTGGSCASITLNRYASFGTIASYATSSASLVMYGSSGKVWTITPSFSGNVRIQIGLNFAGTGQATINYGTGTAPSQGATNTGTICTGTRPAGGYAGTTGYMLLDCYISGQTLSTALWFDIATDNTGGGTSTIQPISIYAQEIP